jgi:hypothetical protein
MEAFLAKHAKNTKRCPNCAMGVTKVRKASLGGGDDRGLRGGLSGVGAGGRAGM